LGDVLNSLLKTEVCLAFTFSSACFRRQ